MRMSVRCPILRPHSPSRSYYTYNYEFMCGESQHPDDESFETDTSPYQRQVYDINISWDDKRIYLQCLDKDKNVISKKNLKNKIPVIKEEVLTLNENTEEQEEREIEDEF